MSFQVEEYKKRRPSWSSSYKTHSKSMKSSQGRSLMDVEFSYEMDRPTFYYVNIVYRQKNEL